MNPASHPASAPASSPARARRWMRRVLLAAALYNLAWAAFMMAWPAGIGRLCGLPAPTPVTLALWQGVGLMIGLLGLGYLIASRDPRRHWGLIFIGLLSKVIGPFGALKGTLDGVFTAEFLLLSIPNDLVWWVPLGLILWKSAKQPLATT